MAGGFGHNVAKPIKRKVVDYALGYTSASDTSFTQILSQNLARCVSGLKVCCATNFYCCRFADLRVAKAKMNTIRVNNPLVKMINNAPKTISLQTLAVESLQDVKIPNCEYYQHFTLYTKEESKVRKSQTVRRVGTAAGYKGLGGKTGDKQIFD